MSFNKRYYNKKGIFDSAERMEFSEFNRWVLSPDAHISSDDFSTNFIEIYCDVKGEERYGIYLSLREGDECAHREIQKYIKE